MDVERGAKAVCNCVAGRGHFNRRCVGYVKAQAGTVFGGKAKLQADTEKFGSWVDVEQASAAVDDATLPLLTSLLRESASHPSEAKPSQVKLSVYIEC